MGIGASFAPCTLQLAPLYLGYSLLTAPKNPPPQVRSVCLAPVCLASGKPRQQPTARREQNGHAHNWDGRCRNLIWRGLKGELKLEQFGAVEALRQCRAEHGDIFRIKIGPLVRPLPTAPHCCPPAPLAPLYGLARSSAQVSATFLIGPEACDVWFKQKNTVFNPGGAYRKFMKCAAPSVAVGPLVLWSPRGH